MSKGRGYTMTDKIIDISGRRRAKECDFAFTTGMMLKDAHELVWLLLTAEHGPKSYGFRHNLTKRQLAALIEQQIISLQSRIAKLKHLAAEEEPGSAS